MSIYACVWATQLLLKFRILLKTSCPGGTDTIALPAGCLGIPSFISVFVLFIFIKSCRILFRRTNSTCCFYRDTITRKVALLSSERPVYPHRRMVIPRQIPNSPRVYIYIYIYIYIYAIYILYIYIYIYIYMLYIYYIYILYIYIYIYIYIHTHTHIYIYIYKHTHIYIYIHTYIYILLYTSTIWVPFIP